MKKEMFGNGARYQRNMQKLFLQLIQWKDDQNHTFYCEIQEFGVKEELKLSNVFRTISLHNLPSWLNVSLLYYLLKR